MIDLREISIRLPDGTDSGTIEKQVPLSAGNGSPALESGTSRLISLKSNIELKKKHIGERTTILVHVKEMRRRSLSR